MSYKLFIITVIAAIFSVLASITFAVFSADKELEFMKWKHQTSSFCRKTNIFNNFKDKIGLLLLFDPCM